MDLPADPYTDLDETLKTKLQAWVSADDKNLLMTVIPDRGLFTLLVAHALKRTADFIRTNDLEYCPDHQKRLLAYIIAGVDLTAENRSSNVAATRALGKTNARNGSGRASRVRATSTGDSDQPTSLRQGD